MKTSLRPILFAFLAGLFAAFYMSSLNLYKSIIDCVSTDRKDSPEEIENQRGLDTISAVSGHIYSGQKIRESAISKTDYSIAPKLSLDNHRCELPLVGVTTTLKARTQCIDETASFIRVVVVGDIGSEPYHNLLNVVYLGLEDQERLYPGLERTSPLRSFSRKNLGFVHAFLGMNACAVWDFDDDNCLSNGTRAFLSSVVSSGLKKPLLWLTSELSTTNPYLLYGSSDFIWPRGFPLEHLSEREFPRVVRSEGLLADVQTDVVQVMQDYDPDVDALWRLENSKSLPMDWKLSAVLKDHTNLVGIHPSRMTPFNAQATVLSRRALAIAFLPTTVHGRVSDIWRSYIIQYFLARAVNPGAVAFSGATVTHHRSKHNYKADFNAESQLYDQTMALIAYLASRPLDGRPAGEAYVSLMDDLYMRGFVEVGDVKAAAAWANLVLTGSARDLLQLQGNSFPALPAPQPRNRAVAVLHINHRHVEAVPIWMALHGHRFQAVQVYVPGLAECLPISGVAIQCISDDFKGYFAYESMLHAMSLNLPQWADAEGFFFLHDDVVWQPTLALGSASRGLGPCLPNSRNGISCFTALNSTAGAAWYWSHIEVGWKAFTLFQAMLSERRDQKAKLEAFMGHGDVYYVSKRDTATFLRYGRQMLQAQLFLEIAVPTLFVACMGVDFASSFRLVTDWSGKRQDPEAMRGLLKDSYADAVHPIKLSTARGILNHMV